MCQGILFHIFSVPPVSYNFPFQKSSQLFPSTLCSSMYLLILLFNVVINGCLEWSWDLLIQSLRYALAFPSLVPLSQIIKRKKKPTQQTPKNQTYTHTHPHTPKSTSTIPMVWMPF